MKSAATRYALSFSTAVLLAACAGSQRPLVLPEPPESASHAVTPASTSSANYNVVYKFKGRSDGFSGINDLIYIGGMLYGATASGGNRGCYVQGCGTLFSLTPSGRKTILYRFGGIHGIGPSGVLIHRGNEMFGVTISGGTAGQFCPKGCGTVFEINTSGLERVLHSFKGTDGQEPVGGLLLSGGKLYGTASAGGRYLYGTVFITDLAGRTKVLHEFRGGHDGILPAGSLSGVNGTFYGTTNQGGSANGCGDSLGAEGCGTIFSITPSGTERVLYRFKGGSDGALPQDGLTNVNGRFYGTTYFGGLSVFCPGGCGTVFEFDPVSHREKIIYEFKGGADGLQPVSGLVELHDILYGTTALGGTGTCSIFYSACGTVFAVTTSGQHSVLHSFYGYPKDGNRPWAGRLLNVNGTLYGATPFGGTESKYYCTSPFHPGCGTVFSLRP